MTELKAAIVGTEIRFDQKYYTVYEIEVTRGTSQWKVYRRYNQFFNLHQQLQKKFPNAFKFPKKKLFGSSMGQEFVEKRTQRLQDYVARLLELPGAAQSTELKIFLEVTGTHAQTEKSEAAVNNMDTRRSTTDEPAIRVRALKDFDPEDEAQLAFKAGEIIAVCDWWEGSDWWEGECNNKVGWFPVNYVEIIDDPKNHIKDKSKVPVQPPRPSQKISDMKSSTTSSNVAPKKFKVLFEFDAKHNLDLPIKEGDIVTILETDISGWWKGECNGKQGWFPSNYVEQL